MNNQLKALSESRREDTGQSRSMPMYKIFNTILVLIILIAGYIATSTTLFI